MMVRIIYKIRLFSKSVFTDSKPSWYWWTLSWGRPEPELGLPLGRQGLCHHHQCIIILKMISKTIKIIMTRVQVVLHAARPTAVLELSPSRKRWPSKTSSSTGHVNQAGPSNPTLTLLFGIFLFFSWILEPGGTTSLCRSR